MVPAMAAEPSLKRARLIPVSGIGSVQEAEQRATSALLAVLTIVRDLSTELLSPLGASRAQNAKVEAFAEVIMKLNGRSIRPDGLIRVSYGKATWSAFVEVKTGDNTLEADQINDYWDLARESSVDHVLTISNEIAPNPNAHPTEGLKVRSNSKVGVTHLSWTAILTTAIRIQQHAGVEDEEQAWILGELIRYLQHPNSGALDFDDMGPHWVSVRDDARTGDLTKRSDGVDDICARWDQLLRFAAFRLASDIGEDVSMVLKRHHQDPKKRIGDLADILAGAGALEGSLRIPNTAGDVELSADVKARQICAAMELAAPEDKGAVGRVSWLIRQLDQAPGDLVVEAYPKNARTPVAARLTEVREDRSILLDGDKREPHRFRLMLRRDMGMGRRTGRKNPGFINSVLDLIDAFYENIVQNVTAWQPPAPRMKRQAAKLVEADDAPITSEEYETPDTAWLSR